MRGIGLVLAVFSPATGHAASAVEPGDATAAPITADYRLPPRAESRATRWLLPDIADEYERAKPPRLRWRVNKVKLRVPIG